MRSAVSGQSSIGLSFKEKAYKIRSNSVSGQRAINPSSNCRGAHPNLGFRTLPSKVVSELGMSNANFEVEKTETQIKITSPVCQFKLCIALRTT